MATAKKNAVAEFYQGLPPIVKILVVAGTGFFAYKVVQGAVRNAKAAAQAAQNAALINSEANAWAQAGQNLTFPIGQYTIMADTLQTAMAGPWYDPTDEEAVKSVLNQLVNNQDFLQLQKAFGIRDKENLTQWIRGDFNANEIPELNSILTSKGIIYQF